ncbi:FAD-dependent oxidoreductase [Cellulomonas denverensis]|uniref:FAD-dependent oxidoreductase n=1 Tax=Cellulomonas denverensis TaxID=264297 RepID=A0A7X6KVI3_9CELL|nr:FAD-dependent oxidoreductase [Cellulomonas denverensis]NKY23042.1 FAD-dependent oxidoreductase [Cellulomonas denverensis]GIG23878.1 pyridine nucleotide-disulfide oxidoreductase [Cellulomonas denverensis]
MARVVVVGGGYGGARVASLLDGDADVTLIEPKDAFVHASAALRAAVDPAWEERVFIPYDRLLERGTVLHQRVERAVPDRVQLADGRTVEADYLVLATGTAYPFPAKFIESETGVARARLARMREGLAAAERVLVVGAGPVGLELVGELRERYPDLAITVVDKEPDALSTGEYLPELRTAIREQLTGVDFVLGSRLGYLPPVDVGVYGPFAVDTQDGVRIEAQMWFRCYGNQADSGYFAGDLADRRDGLGQLRVEPTLQVRGLPTVFAVGDVTDVPESKRASAARAHADVVAVNIRSLIAGEPAVATHEPEPERIVLPLGTRGGASQIVDAEGRHRILGAEETSRIKGQDLFSTDVAELFGQL